MEERPLEYIGVVDGGPDDSLRVEEILNDIFKRIEDRERGDT